MDVLNKRRADDHTRHMELADILADGGTMVSEWDVVADRVRWIARPDGFPPDAYPDGARFADILAAVHPEDRARFKARIDALLETGSAYAGESRLLLPDGSTRWLTERGRLRRDPSGRPLVLTIIAMDVTPLREAERELARSRRRFRAMHDNSPDAVVLCRPERGADGKIADFVYTYLNPTALRMVGRTGGEMLGRGMLEFFPGNREAGLHDRYVQAFETGEPHVSEFPYDGSGITGWFRNTVVRVEEELAITVADITARKQAEEGLREALAARTMLMREMNHRVKNSLQMVASLIQLHRMRSQSAEVRSVFEDVSARVRAVAEVHRLLYQGDRIGEVDLGGLLRPVADGVDGINPGGVTVTLPEEPVLVPVDQGIPVGLIANELMTNAAKHAYAGGDGPIFVHLSHEDDGSLELTIRDEGKGLPPGLEWREGKSLGLMLLRSLTAQIDGDFMIDSGPAGTTATVRWRV